MSTPPPPGASGAGHITPAPTSQADIDLLRPLVHTWAAGEPMWHVYNVGYGARDFYGGDPANQGTWGRFHPFIPVGGTDPLPVYYAANDVLGALAETVFHDVPAGPKKAKRVPFAKLRHRLEVAVESTRDLKLADLRGFGIKRLGVSRAELLESGPPAYAETAPWGRALHAHPENVDGMVWVSRQHDMSQSVVLFGDRVSAGDLAVVEDHIPLTLAAGNGLELVLAAANQADITITGL